jgi:HSP20 family molecular chaperone IbpA
VSDPFGAARRGPPAASAKEDSNMLARWNNDYSVFPSLGFRDFPRLSRDLDRLLYAFERPHDFSPRVTFEERAEAWVLKSELPGFSEKEIDITVTGTTVTLRVQRQTEAKAEGEQQAAQASYRYERTFELPAKVDPDRVEAALKLGVLTVTLPKAAETMPKQIAVKAV